MMDIGENRQLITYIPDEFENSWLKFETSRELLIILEESIDKYTSNE
jgi:hypothetical protein